MTARRRLVPSTASMHAGKRAGQAIIPPGSCSVPAGRQKGCGAHRQDLRCLRRASHRGVPPAGVLLVRELRGQRQHGLQGKMAGGGRTLFAC
jgi:hypothetical protein